MSMQPPDDAARYLLGPWVIGTCIELVFQGVLFAQFAKYFTTFPGDPPSLKAYVGVLLLLTCLKSAQAFACIWHPMIPQFGNTASLYTNLGRTWYSATIGASGHTITLWVQGYFCFRLFVISRSRSVVAAVSVFLIASYMVVWVGTALLFRRDESTAAKWFISYAPLVLAADMLLTGTTAYFLLKNRRVTQSSTGLLNALTVLTFQTAAPAAICAFLLFLLSVTFPERYPFARPTAALASNIVLAKLYPFSVMWTLNARREMRRAVKGTDVVDSSTGW